MQISPLEVFFGIAIVAGAVMMHSRFALSDLAPKGEGFKWFFSPAHSWKTREELEKEFGKKAKPYLDRYYAALVVLICDSLAIFVFAILMQPEKS